MNIRIALFNLALFITGCAGLRPAGENSQIEISYLRGSNSHRYVLNEEKENAKIKAFKDQYLMKEMDISLDNFSRIADDTAIIFDSLKRTPAGKELSPCRTPFVIRVKDAQNNKSVEGCRSSNEGAALGKLIKDVEFLMASPAATRGEVKKN